MTVTITYTSTCGVCANYLRGPGNLFVGRLSGLNRGSDSLVRLSLTRRGSGLC